MSSLLRSSRAGIGIVLGLYLALTLLYNGTMPVWEAPDEYDHFQYVRLLATERRLPFPEEQLPSLKIVPSSEIGQPPPYYALGALLTGWIDTSNAAYARFNPGVTWDPRTGKAIAIHTEDESFPYYNAALAVHLLRLLSSLLGLVTVWCTYLVAREITQDRAVALAASAFTAFTPGFLFSSASVNNDSLVTAFGSLAVLTSVKMVGRARWTWLGLALYGLVLAGSIAAKRNGYFVLPLAAVVLALPAIQRLLPDTRRRVGALAAAGVLAVPAWLLYGDYLLGGEGATGFLAPSFVSMKAAGVTPGQLVSLVQGQFVSYWGFFGWQTIYMDVAVYVAYGLLVALCLAGLTTFARHESGWRGLSQRGRLQTGIVALAMLILLAPTAVRYLLGSLTSPGYDHARYIFPVITGFSFFLSLGLVHISRRVRLPRLPLAVCGAMAAAAAFIPLVYIAPAYVPPLPVRTNIETVRIAQPVESEFESGVAFLGSSSTARSYRPGDTIEVALFWTALRDGPPNNVASIQALDFLGNVRGLADAVPLDHVFPPSEWRKGEIIRDERRLQLAADAPPGVYRIEVAMYDSMTAKDIPARANPSAPPQDRVLLSTFKVSPPSVAPDSIQHPTDARFGNDIRLLGYNLRQARDRKLGVVLFWEAENRITEDYTVSLQLLDGRGTLAAQRDSKPANAYYPTTVWEPGEIITDAHVVSLPAELARGEHTLQVVLYSGPEAERLQVLQGNQPLPGDRLVLQSLVLP